MGIAVARPVTKNATRWILGCAVLGQHAAFLLPVRALSWDSDIFVSLTEYRYCQVLLFRPKAIENLSSTEAERDTRARMAADSITRIAEDLLAAGMIKCGQIHLYDHNTFLPSLPCWKNCVPWPHLLSVPALFGALSIHTIVICQKDHIRRQLAENKSRQCMLALSELASSWPVNIWISKAFINLLRRLTGPGSIVGGSILSVSSSIVSNRTNVASSGHLGSLGLQHTTSPQSHFFHAIEGDQATPNSLDRCETSIRPHDLHAPDQLLPEADRLSYDRFWPGCFDNSMDVDMILHSSLWQRLSAPCEGLNGVREPNTPGL